MRRILIALALAMASTEAATQTTEGAEERTEQRTLTERVSEWVQRTIGWAPTGQVRELQAELEQLTTALDQREDAVRRNEEAVRQQAARNRRRGAELRNQAAALEQQEEEVEEGLLQADQTMKESRAIALTAAILAAAAGGWSLWRLQPSTVARLKQRRRTAEQGLRAMRAEWDEAHAKLRKKASALTAAKRKNNVLRNALDGAEARCRDAMAAAEETTRMNTGLRQALDGMETRFREAESTIRLLNAANNRLKVEIEDAQRNGGGPGTQEGTAREFLGVPAGASRNDIRAAWKRVARTVHPDHCGGPEAKRLMQLANDALAWLGAA